MGGTDVRRGLGQPYLYSEDSWGENIEVWVDRVWGEGDMGIDECLVSKGNNSGPRRGHERDRCRGARRCGPGALALQWGEVKIKRRGGQQGGQGGGGGGEGDGSKGDGRDSQRSGRFAGEGD